VSLVARHLEANGIPTVVIGSARDVVDACGVPRFLFADFPLGNPCGRPFEQEMQRKIAEMSLDLLESAERPRTTKQVPFRWAEGEEDDAWRENYLRLDEEQRAKLRDAGNRRREKQRRAKQQGTARSD
jgi:D-proline reductase (dithiol) PrdB